MTQYYSDFSEYADTTALLAEWTARWVTSDVTWSLVSDAGATGGKFLRAVRLTNARSGLSWNDIDADSARADFEVLAKVRTSAAVTSGVSVFGRGAGASDAESAYVGQMRSDGGQWRVIKYVAGTFTSVIESGGTSSINTWYWVRFRVNGTAIKLRAWADGGSEPGTWDLEVTDASLSDAGWLGAFLLTAQTADWDVFTVGTNGEAAPSEPLTPSGPAITNVPNMTVGVQAIITGTGFGN